MWIDPWICISIIHNFFGQNTPKLGSFTDDDKRLHQEFRRRIDTKDHGMQTVGFLFFEPVRYVLNCQLMRKNSDGTKVFIHSSNSAGYGSVSIDNPRLLYSDNEETSFHSKRLCPDENDTTIVIFDNFIKLGSRHKHNVHSSNISSNSDLRRDQGNYSIKIKCLNQYCNGGSPFVKMGIFGINRRLLKACTREIEFESSVHNLYNTTTDSNTIVDDSMEAENGNNITVENIDCNKHTNNNNIDSMKIDDNIDAHNIDPIDRLSNSNSDHNRYLPQTLLFSQVLFDQSISVNNIEYLNSDTYESESNMQTRTDGNAPNITNSSYAEQSQTSFNQLIGTLSAAIKHNNPKFNQIVNISENFDFYIINNRMQKCTFENIIYPDEFNNESKTINCNKKNHISFNDQDKNQNHNHKLTCARVRAPGDINSRFNGVKATKPKIDPSTLRIDLKKLSLKKSDWFGEITRAERKQLINEITMSFVKRQIANKRSDEGSLINETDTKDHCNYEYCLVLQDNICNFQKEFVLSNDKEEDFEYIVFMEFENCHCSDKIPYVIENKPAGRRFGFEWSAAKKNYN